LGGLAPGLRDHFLARVRNPTEVGH
jgi:hypothetical protein